MAASGGATELISFDPSTKKFVLASSAIQILKKLHGPVAIVSVCGRARMGKSTLLNQLLQKLSGGTQKGFTTAASHKPCTKGLWLWSKPIERMLPDGRKMHLVGGSPCRFLYYRCVCPETMSYLLNPLT